MVIKRKSIHKVLTCTLAVFALLPVISFGNTTVISAYVGFPFICHNMTFAICFFDTNDGLQSMAPFIAMSYYLLIAACGYLLRSYYRNNNTAHKILLYIIFSIDIFTLLICCITSFETLTVSPGMVIDALFIYALYYMDKKAVGYIAQVPDEAICEPIGSEGAALTEPMAEPADDKPAEQANDALPESTYDSLNTQATNSVSTETK